MSNQKMRNKSKVRNHKRAMKRMQIRNDNDLFNLKYYLAYIL